MAQVIESVREWLLSMNAVGYEFLDQEVQIEEANPSPK